MQHVIFVVTGWIFAAVGFVAWQGSPAEAAAFATKVLTLLGVTLGAMVGGIGDMMAGFNLAQGS